MTQWRAYRDYVEKTAPAGYKKEIRRACLGLVVWIAAAVLAAPYLGVEIRLIPQIAAVALAGLIYFTYLPAFSLLLALLGLVSVIVSVMDSFSLGGYGVLIIGWTCYLSSRKLFRGYKAFQKDGARILDDASGVILGPSQPVGTESFVVRSRCPICGSSEQILTGTKYGRFTLRYSSHSADWRMQCPQCKKDVPVKSSKAKKLALENGQFPAFRRAEIPNGWLVGFVLSFAVMIGAIVLAAILIRSDAVVFSNDVSSPNLGTGKQFVGESLQIIDCFAVESEESWDWDWADAESIYALHMIAYFETENGRYLLPVKILPDKDIFPACLEYLNDWSAAAIVSNVHGYIDRLPDDLAGMFSEMVQVFTEDAPDLIPVSAEVIYWNAEAAPSADEESVFTCRAAAIGAAALSILFFGLDRYVNGGAYSETVQRRYDRRKSGRRI